jgi:Flp pilus assembly pilin Flp
MASRFVRRLAASTRGAGLTEYIVVAGVVALLAIAGFHLFGGKLTSTSQRLANDVQQLGADQAVASNAGACTGGVCAPGSGNCFVAGTPVLTPAGEVPIERIAEGDLVVSADEATGAVVVSRVGRTYVRLAPALVDVRVTGADGRTETLRATPEHRFWTADAGWRGAGALREGEALVDAQARAAVVATSTALPAESVVYNFEVDRTHTYFVGSSRVLVHNPSYPPQQPPPQQQPPQQQPPSFAPPYIPVNDNQGNTTNNCYYASTAALAGQSCSQLANNTGVPVPPGQASTQDTADFMQHVGVGNGQYYHWQDPAQANQWLLQQAQTAAPGQAFGISYWRHDGSGHTVTGFVDENHHLHYVDFQTNPPTVADGIAGSSVANGVAVFPTTVNVQNNPAFQQLPSYHQGAPNGELQ